MKNVGTWPSCPAVLVVPDAALHRDRLRRHAGTSVDVLVGLAVLPGTLGGKVVSALLAPRGLR
jgi:hypothetical protein